MPFSDNTRLALEPTEKTKQPTSAINQSTRADTQATSITTTQQAAAQQAAANTPMMAQYWRIKKQHPDSLLFYRMGDFYELFFEDAEKAAVALDIALTQRGNHDGKPVKMCGVPAHSHEPYLAKLIRQGFRVAICEQTEDPRQARARRGSAALIERAVVRTITPGTLTEEAFLDARKPCVICAIASHSRGGKNSFAIAWLDLTAATFFCQSISLEELPSVFARIEPREVILPEEMLCQAQLFETLEAYKDALTPMPKSRFDSENAENFLKRHFHIDSLQAFGKLQRTEISAAGTLLDYVQLTQGEATPDVQNLEIFSQNTHLEIDATTRKTLEIFDTNSDNPRATLIINIDACNSALGARLLRERIANPLRDKKSLDKRLDAIEFFLKQNNAIQQVAEILKGCPDGIRALARIALQRGSPRDLGAVAGTLTRACQIKTLLEKICIENKIIAQKNAKLPDAKLPDKLQAAKIQLGAHDALQQKLEQALLENLPTLARVGGFLSENFAPELRDLRIKKDEALRYLRTIEYNAKKATGIEALKVKYNAIIGYFFEVPTRHANKMQNNAKQNNAAQNSWQLSSLEQNNAPSQAAQNYFTHRQSTASAARFSSKELEKCAHTIAQTQERLSACENRLYEELVDEVIKQREDLRKAFEALAYIDLTAAMARIAQERNYSRPQFIDEPILDIREGKHPVLDAMQQYQQQDGRPQFVANDCQCSEKNFFKLITGPNMAGKSTYLRQNALIIVMAQSGCFVPAKTCRLGIVDRLCSRMGAADDLASGKSTFMLEMSETAAIVRQATENSFLILDEIGRGTATYDGLAIAWAIVEHLVDKTRCRTLFATHYHELTELDKTLNPLETLHMKIIEDQNSIAFQYKIAKGATGRSYGIHVAERAGLPRTILARAKQILEQLEKQGEARKKHTNAIGEIQLGTNHLEDSKNLQTQKILDELAKIEPDALSPKQALEKLYALRAMRGAMAAGDGGQKN